MAIGGEERETRKWKIEYGIFQSDALIKTEFNVEVLMSME